MADLTLGVIDDVGAVAQAAAAFFKFVDNVNAIANSPAMILARKNEDVQRVLESWDADLKSAQASGDITKIDVESSG